MSDIPALGLSLGAGAMLGVVFFGGLWWTVQMAVGSALPALWFFVSLLARVGVILIGFYFVSQGHWSRLVACLLGFLVARVTVVRWLARSPTAAMAPTADEMNHAP